MKLHIETSKNCLPSALSPLPSLPPTQLPSCFNLHPLRWKKTRFYPPLHNPIPAPPPPPSRLLECSIPWLPGVPMQRSKLPVIFHLHWHGSGKKAGVSEFESQPGLLGSRTWSRPLPSRYMSDEWMSRKGDVLRFHYYKKVTAFSSSFETKLFFFNSFSSFFIFTPARLKLPAETAPAMSWSVLPPHSFLINEILKKSWQCGSWFRVCDKRHFSFYVLGNGDCMGPMLTAAWEQGGVLMSGCSGGWRGGEGSCWCTRCSWTEGLLGDASVGSSWAVGFGQLRSTREPLE